LKEWDLPGQFEPLDISPDGTRFVVKNNPWPDGVLTLFSVSPDLKLFKTATIAHDRISLNPNEANAKAGEIAVAWAGFLGNDRVASAAVGGQVRVFKTNGTTLTALGTLEGTPGLTPCVTPDRKRLLAHAGGKLVLVDPAAAEAVATKALPLAAGPRVLAVSPDGATLACAKQGRIRFLSLKTGEYWDHTIPDFGFGSDVINHHHLAWSGPSFLAYGRHIFDPTVTYPVWTLPTQTHADAYSSRQVWAAVRLPGPEAKSGPPINVAVRVYNPLPPDLSGIVGAAKARPGVYVISAGAAVRVDATKLPAEKQASAKSDFEQRLREIGYVPKAEAAPVFSLTLDPAITKTTNYTKLTSIQYSHQPLRVQIRHEGKLLREHALVKTPPLLVSLTATDSLTRKAAAEGWGQPNYDMLKTMDIQPHFPGNAYPTNGFGFTDIHLDSPQYRTGR
ncbi:MAG TPA: hypothetical protein VH092_10305, partial [Urbifossiella sp.]|nr:hypothetical protein [Urbifossiella sp.]